MKRLLFWFCLVVVLLPMTARLLPGERKFNLDILESFTYVGDIECGIPTAPFDRSCTSLPGRPLILATMNETALNALDAVALGWLLLCALRSALADRFAAPSGFRTPAVALSCMLAAFYLLDIAALYQWPVLSTLRLELQLVLQRLLVGHAGLARPFLSVLWFWVVLMPPLFELAGRRVGVALPSVVDGAMRPRITTVRAAGAFVVLAVVVVAFGASALIHPLPVSDLPSPFEDGLAALGLGVALVGTVRALLLHFSRARTIAITLAVVSLAGGPVGVFVGAYVLWQLVVARAADEANADTSRSVV